MFNEKQQFLLKLNLCTAYLIVLGSKDGLEENIEPINSGMAMCNWTELAGTGTVEVHMLQT